VLAPDSPLSLLVALLRLALPSPPTPTSYLFICRCYLNACLCYENGCVCGRYTALGLHGSRALGLKGSRYCRHLDGCTVGMYCRHLL
jgi:hypothetical protein